MINKCLYCYNFLNENEIDFHAHCSKKFFGTVFPPEIPFIMSDIEKLALTVLGKSVSVTGVQPKISLETEKLSRNHSRFTIVGLWGNYILKPPVKEYPEMCEIEDLTMHLASLLKIKVAKHSLIRLKSGEICYITRRFDRVKKLKLHVEDMAQLTGKLTEYKYKGSMEKVASIVAEFSSSPGLDLYGLYELTLFSFLTGNADMHLKNFSLLTGIDDEIRLSPAYDLLSTKLLIPEDKEQLALTINGKKNRLTYKDFRAFGLKLQIPEKSLETARKKFISNRENVTQFIEKSFLSNTAKEKYLTLYDERLNLLT